MSLNPLHCGAVVASLRGDADQLRKGLVSIPFIAGQWSLRPMSSCRTRKNSCLNPLHCGAVVASNPEYFRCSPSSGVSIPFIAGQWSLPRAALPRRTRGLVSIPFIAGQWSLRHLGFATAGRQGWFQSPSLRGSGRFQHRAARRREDSRVSIPFIAGQWSLRRAETRASVAGAGGFNPLHCGAVVASRRRRQRRRRRRWFQSPSLRGSGRFSRWRTRFPNSPSRFNPLHCGAVVASGSHYRISQ